MSLTHKELVDELKIEWKKLWQERVDDKVRAEGIAITDYNSLFIDKGTVIHATRDFKALNFKEILEKYAIENTDRYVPPNPQIGGWTKFVKDHITSNRKKKLADLYVQDKKEKQQLKQNGRGWLHK